MRVKEQYKTTNKERRMKSVEIEGSSLLFSTLLFDKILYKQIYKQFRVFTCTWTDVIYQQLEQFSKVICRSHFQKCG
jgi:hypothetical protein